MTKLSEEEQAKEDRLRESFLALSSDEQGQVYTRLRRRIIRYGKMTDEESGKVVTEMCENLDLNAMQTGRLQMIVRNSNERVRQAIRELDAQSPALHPLDRYAREPDDEA